MRLERNRLWLAFGLGLGAFGLGWAIALLAGFGGARDLPEPTAARPPAPAVIERGDFRPRGEVPALYEEPETPVEAESASIASAAGSVSSAPAPSPTTPATGLPPLTAEPGGTDAQLP